MESKLATTDFDKWLAENGPDDNNEAFQLHRALSEKVADGRYICTEAGGKTFLKAGQSSQLVLTSDKAVKAFQKRILQDFCPDPDIGWELSEGYQRAMNSPKS